MIKYYNRKSKKYEIEKVAGEKYLNWIYSSPIGMNLLELVIKKKLFSSLYGKYCDTKISKKKIDNFIKDFNIDIKICSSSLNDFNSFNDFFTRKLKKDSRPMSKDKDILISPGDGKLLAYENINLNKVSNIKGINYSFYELVKDKKLADKYSNGTCLILRLCPTDYHRFHFIDDGICTNTTKIKGDYYSVNPLALIKVPQLFCKNKREYSTFHSENFGNILFMEVGATCVGSIIQTYIPDKKVLKGEEKGYFKFGGSTVILFFEKGKIKIDPDILKQTESGYETQIFLGESIGYKVK